MKILKPIIAAVLSIACMGVTHAYQAPAPMLVQQHVVVHEVYPTMVVAQVRQRRFVMPPNGGVVYQRGTAPVQQYGNVPPPNVPRTTRMTVEERRALRSQINEANRGIYRAPRPRSVQH